MMSLLHWTLVQDPLRISLRFVLMQFFESDVWSSGPLLVIVSETNLACAKQLAAG